MSEFEILDNYPKPEKKSNLKGGTQTRYPFATMEVGQCLLVEAGPTGSTVNCKGYHAMRRFMERDHVSVGGQGREFSAAKLDAKPGWVGIWRDK